MWLLNNFTKDKYPKKKETLWIVIIFCSLSVTSYYAFKHYSYPLRNTYSHITSLSSFLYDFSLINTNSGKAIYKNGRVRKGIRNEYGETLFKLYYKDVHIVTMSHFKENSWETYDYELISGNRGRQT